MKALKCLTVSQPYAWAIIHGAKRIENRTWRTPYRGPLLIHAGLSREWMGPFLCDGQPAEADMVFGAAIGVIDLVDIVRFEDEKDDPFAFGPWCWRLRNPRPFPAPVPMKGKLHLFDPPSHLLSYVASELS